MTEPLEPIVEMLRAEVHRAEASNAVASRREEMAQAIRLALVETKLRETRRRRVAIAVGVGLAAGTLLMLGRMRAREEVQLVMTNVHGTLLANQVPVGEVTHLQEGMPLESTTETVLSYETGTTVHLEPKTQLMVLSQGKNSHFSLAQGTLTAQVTKLKVGERFVVQTPDSNVEVRGTKFTVRIVNPEPRCGDAVTRVDVTEGVVRVERHGVRTDVHAGESWPVCAPTPTVIASAERSTEPSAAKPVAMPPPRHEAIDAIPRSTLALQNDLFADALLRKRSGDTSGALQALDTLTREYPRGPLTESAYAEKFRISGKAEAARTYLKRYPRGFAKSEAEALLH